MDIPCTQLLVDDLDESGLSETSDRRQVGTIVIKEDNKLGITEAVYSIYEGENTIGRHESCDIAIPLGVTLSKKHACIEADKSSCYIYDCGSSNKTKLGSLKLKPEVRYCLQDGSDIVFANVKCVYKQGDASTHKSTINKTSPFERGVFSPPPLLIHPHIQSQDKFVKIQNEPGPCKVESKESVNSTGEDEPEANFEISDSDTDLEDTIPCDEGKEADSVATDVEDELLGIDTIAETPRNSFVAVPQDLKDGAFMRPFDETDDANDSDSNDAYSLLTAARTQVFSSQVMSIGEEKKNDFDAKSTPTSADDRSSGTDETENIHPASNLSQNLTVKDTSTAPEIKNETITEECESTPALICKESTNELINDVTTNDISGLAENQESSFPSLNYAKSPSIENGAVLSQKSIEEQNNLDIEPTSNTALELTDCSTFNELVKSPGSNGISNKETSFLSQPENASSVELEDITCAENSSLVGCSNPETNTNDKLTQSYDDTPSGIEKNEDSRIEKNENVQPKSLDTILQEPKNLSFSMNNTAVQSKNRLTNDSGLDQSEIVKLKISNALENQPLSEQVQSDSQLNSNELQHQESNNVIETTENFVASFISSNISIHDDKKDQSNNKSTNTAESGGLGNKSVEVSTDTSDVSMTQKNNLNHLKDQNGFFATAEKTDCRISDELINQDGAEPSAKVNTSKCQDLRKCDDSKDPSLNISLSGPNPCSNLSIYNMLLPDSYISDGGSDEDIFHSTPTSDVENEPYACAETQPFADCGVGVASSRESPQLPPIFENSGSTSTPLKSLSNFFTPQKKQPIASPFLTPSSVSCPNENAPKTPESIPNKPQTSEPVLSHSPDAHVTPGVFALPTRPRRKGRGKNTKLNQDMYEYSLPKRRKPREKAIEEGLKKPFSKSQPKSKRDSAKALTDTSSTPKDKALLNLFGEPNEVCQNASAQDEDPVQAIPVVNGGKLQNSAQSDNSSNSSASQIKIESTKTVINNDLHSIGPRRSTRNKTSELANSESCTKARYSGQEPRSMRQSSRLNSNPSMKDDTQEKEINTATAHVDQLRKSKRISQTTVAAAAKIPKKELPKKCTAPSQSERSTCDKTITKVAPNKSEQRRTSNRRTRTRLMENNSDASSADETSSISSTVERKKRRTNQITSDISKKEADSNPDTDFDDDLVHSAALALRPRKIKPKVMFTGVIDKLGESIVRELGGQLTDDMHECTHLVTDKMRRTVKFLCAVVRGIFIVNQDWLRKSKDYNRFLSEDAFELSDDKPSQTPSSSTPSPSTSIELQFGFKLSESLTMARSRTKPLFNGCCIHVTKNVLPPPDQMYQIIECGGGKKVAKMPKTNNLTGVFVISTEEDEKLCAAAIKNDIPIFSKELILTGILRQKLDLKKNRLFQNTKPQRTISTRSKCDPHIDAPEKVTSSNRTTRSRSGRRKPAA